MNIELKNKIGGFCWFGFFKFYFVIHHARNSKNKKERELRLFYFILFMSYGLFCNLCGPITKTEI